MLIIESFGAKVLVMLEILRILIVTHAFDIRVIPVIENRQERQMAIFIDTRL